MYVTPVDRVCDVYDASTPFELVACLPTYAAPPLCTGPQLADLLERVTVLCNGEQLPATCAGLLHLHINHGQQLLRWQKPVNPLSQDKKIASTSWGLNPGPSPSESDILSTELHVPICKVAFSVRI